MYDMQILKKPLQLIKICTNKTISLYILPKKNNRVVNRSRSSSYFEFIKEHFVTWYGHSTVNITIKT